MAKKEEEQQMFMMPIPMSSGGDPLDTYMKYQKFFEEMKKEETEKKKKTARREPAKFSFFETLGFAIMFGPVIGFGYLYAVKYALNYVEAMFK
jgi:hypothetical protein